MANQHSPDKEPLSLQIPRTLKARLSRRAVQLGVSLPELVISILNEKTINVTLTSADYKAITEATKHAEKTGKRCATQFEHSARTKGKAVARG